MYCNRCGTQLPEEARFCSSCGYQLVSSAGVPVVRPRLRRPQQGRKIAGVCAGVAEYLDTDPTLVRIVWAATILIGLSGIVAYLVAWVLIPEEPVPVSNTLSNPVNTSPLAGPRVAS